MATTNNEEGLRKIHPFRLSERFKKESTNFTPWLASNLDVISEALNISIINPSTESSSENFRVDIEAELEDGAKVVIENQFGSSDHDHLGKIITYRTAHEAKVAIWIVEDARQEHIDAINWLNETDNGCDFYLLEARLIKIDDSPYALDINKLAWPSKALKEKGKMKKEARSNEMCYKFWKVFFKEVKSDSSLSVFKTKDPLKSNYINDSTGVSGIFWSVKASQNYLQCRVYIDKGKGTKNKNFAILNKLKEDREKIEKEFGDKLEWISSEDRRASIEYQIIGGWGDPEEKWPELAKLLLHKMKIFVNALKGPISKLK